MDGQVAEGNHRISTATPTRPAPSGQSAAGGTEEPDAPDESELGSAQSFAQAGSSSEDSDTGSDSGIEGSLQQREGLQRKRTAARSTPGRSRTGSARSGRMPKRPRLSAQAQMRAHVHEALDDFQASLRPSGSRGPQASMLTQAIAMLESDGQLSLDDFAWAVTVFVEQPLQAEAYVSIGSVSFRSHYIEWLLGLNVSAISTPLPLYRANSLV